MSTTVTIVNEDEFNHHLGSVRDDDSDTNWYKKSQCVFDVVLELCVHM